eukprot:11216550-Lingulodinium_polyedra.AAC.1
MAGRARCQLRRASTTDLLQVFAWRTSGARAFREGSRAIRDWDLPESEFMRSASRNKETADSETRETRCRNPRGLIRKP